MTFSLPDPRRLSNEVLEALRIRAVYGCERGFPEAEIADLLGVSQAAVRRWWTAYTEGGLGALTNERTGRPAGSGRVLSDSQARQIQDLIENHSPGELGIPAPLWNRRSVCDLILRECGIAMKEPTVGVYLKRWGCTARALRRQARRRDRERAAMAAGD
jgi:transposase